MIKLYAKQRRLVKILTAQIEERENLSQISAKSYSLMRLGENLRQVIFVNNFRVYSDICQSY